MEHLLQAWPKVAARLKAARRILLFSDFDGTLTPIVERPEDAFLAPAMRRLLQALARNSRYLVGIISGRALKDLEARVDVPGLIYAGNHGLEIEGPGLSFISPLAEEMKSLLHLLQAVLSRSLAGIKGVLVENKGLTLSVHYRQVAELEEGLVSQIFHRVTRTAQMVGKIRVTPGKKVYEIRPPVDWNKGKAIEYIMARHDAGGRRGPGLPLYLGDDFTDEDGFASIERCGGISIFVGEDNPGSRASYFLRSPQEVEGFLTKLAELK